MMMIYIIYKYIFKALYAKILDLIYFGHRKQKHIIWLILE